MQSSLTVLLSLLSSAAALPAGLVLLWLVLPKVPAAASAGPGPSPSAPVPAASTVPDDLALTCILLLSLALGAGAEVALVLLTLGAAACRGPGSLCVRQQQRAPSASPSERSRLLQDCGRLLWRLSVLRCWSWLLGLLSAVLYLLLQALERKF